MKQLRQYLREERQISPEWLYLSSYWKLGSTDEEHKEAKAAEATA
jgi:NADPH-dependent ferric siderophore reductase